MFSLGVVLLLFQKVSLTHKDPNTEFGKAFNSKKKIFSSINKMEAFTDLGVL